MGNDDVIRTDVAVIGYGGAGAAAAISAHDSGSDVLILEKTPDGGGNTALSTGILTVPTGPGMTDFVQALCFGKTGLDIIRTYVDGCSQIPGWVRELGGETEVYQPLDVVYPTRLPSWPNFPGTDEVEMRRISGLMGGERPGMLLWKLLRNNVERRNIKVLSNTPARELMTNEKREVVGLAAEGHEGQIRIEARKAVVLACGGFDFNDDLKDTYLPLSPTYSLGHPGNTGDGLLMAQKVGAALWHMSSFAGGLGFKAAEYPSVFSLYFHLPSFIFVDKGGRRFGDETGWEIHNRWRALMVFKRLGENYPQLPAYAIFDEAARRKGPLCGILSSPNDYKWSLDNSKEVARGWIKQGKTLEELAKKISVDGAILARTVARYNLDCESGVDTQWDRSRESLEPIGAGPYYAIEQWPSAATWGGPRRNRESRVVGSGGSPIPRLYSAGSLGSIWGSLATVGAGLTDAIVFGRIAGRNAAGEERW